MKFKLFQVKRNLIGTHTHNFSDLKQMGIEVDLKNYNDVYKGESNLTDRFDLLEALFDEFNTDHPKDFRGRSMSVSDIVQLDDRYYFCDSVGWQQVII